MISSVTDTTFGKIHLLIWERLFLNTEMLLFYSEYLSDVLFLSIELLALLFTWLWCYINVVQTTCMNPPVRHIQPLDAVLSITKASRHRRPAEPGQSGTFLFLPAVFRNPIDIHLNPVRHTRSFSAVKHHCSAVASPWTFKSICSFCSEHQQRSRRLFFSLRTRLKLCRNVPVSGFRTTTPSTERLVLHSRSSFCTCPGTPSPWAFLPSKLWT